MEISQNFVAFSECMNFKYLGKSARDIKICTTLIVRSNFKSLKMAFSKEYMYYKEILDLYSRLAAMSVFDMRSGF